MSITSSTATFQHQQMQPAEVLINGEDIDELFGFNNNNNSILNNPAVLPNPLIIDPFYGLDEYLSYDVHDDYHCTDTTNTIIPQSNNYISSPLINNPLFSTSEIYFPPSSTIVEDNHHCHHPDLFENYFYYHHPKRLKTTTTTTAEAYINNQNYLWYNNPCGNFSLHSSYGYPSSCLDFVPELFLPPMISTEIVQSNCAINGGGGGYFMVGMNWNNKYSKVDDDENQKQGLSAQSSAARQRRRKITEKTKELGQMVPGADKMNTAEMFHAAYKYVKFLQAQIGILELLTEADTNGSPLSTSIQEEGSSSSKELEDTGVVVPLQLPLLLECPSIQEKLYSEERCLVPKEFIEKLAEKHHNHPEILSTSSNPLISKQDIDRLLFG